MRQVPPVLATEVLECVTLAHAPQPHRPVPPSGCALRRGHDDRDAAVGDEAAVEQVQRIDDHARGLMVRERDRVFHHRMLGQGSVAATVHRDPAELLACRAIERHVPPRADRAIRGVAEHAPDAPRVAAARGGIELRALGARRVTEDAGHGVRHPGRDGHGRELHERAGCRATHGQRSREARVDADVLAEREVMLGAFGRRAARHGQEAVDVVLLDTGIGDRVAQCFGR